jgi:hypothetical protein
MQHFSRREKTREGGSREGGYVFVMIFEELSSL